jgi:tRNA (guanine26-N2/guanine27-N2)-dimethyltransferase
MGEEVQQGEHPAGWPGHMWLEGRTLIHLMEEQERPTHMPRGPAKRTGPGFLNPAMAPARTRSVMLLADALEHEWLVKEQRPIRALDALCATGVRIRRWRNEIPAELQHRLRITANDLDEFALAWAQTSHEQHPPEQPVEHEPEDDRHGQTSTAVFDNGVHFQRLDARMAMVGAAYQWVDLDPFGSPIQFLDAALQSLSRTGVVEVTATDTAALTGSSPSSQARRYQAKGLVDAYAHDDAVRLLIATVATTAARLDKVVTPLLALFDGHHVRISLLVRTSKSEATAIRKSIGWRVRCKDVPYRFVQHPSPEDLPNASGPLWIGPMWHSDIAGRMTEERALEMCHPTAGDIELARSQGLTWDEEDIEHSAREVRRSVRHIAAAADLMSREHLLLNLDTLPRLAGVGGAPKMEKLIAALIEAGHAAARYPDLEPMLVTDAPFETVVQIVQNARESSD